MVWRQHRQNKILDTLASCKTEEERKAVSDAYKQISNGQDLGAMVGDKPGRRQKGRTGASSMENRTSRRRIRSKRQAKPQGMFAFIGPVALTKSG